MFKFVVLCALLAAAAAEPGLIAPITYSGGYVAPVSYPYYSNGFNKLVYSSPYVPSAVTYNAPVAHFIKKRSAPLVSTYVAPTPLHTTYASTYSTFPGYSPFATTYGAAYPSLYSSPLYTTGHLIKKRSAPFLPVASTYIAPTTYTSTYTAASPLVYPYSSVVSPYYTAGAYSFPAQFIKK